MEPSVGKPTRHRDKWRIRWVDDHGVRQSEVHPDYKAAAFVMAGIPSTMMRVARAPRARCPRRRMACARRTGSLLSSRRG